MFFISLTSLGYLHELQNQQIFAETNMSSKITFLPYGINFSVQDTLYSNNKGIIFWQTKANSTRSLTYTQIQQFYTNENPFIPSLEFLNVADAYYLSIIIGIIAGIIIMLIID